MDVRDYLTVSKYVNDCPNCGSAEVGEGFGTISANESIFERTCECGFKFKYDVNAGVKQKQIKQAIDEALSEC